MFAFLTQRLLQVIPTLILVSMLIFGLQQLLPGDPALIMAGEERDPKLSSLARNAVMTAILVDAGDRQEHAGPASLAIAMDTTPTETDYKYPMHTKT